MVALILCGRIVVVITVRTVCSVVPDGDDDCTVGCALWIVLGVTSLSILISVTIAVLCPRLCMSSMHCITLHHPDILFQAALRPVHLVSPSMACVAEVLLLSCGFSDSHALGRGLNSLMEHLESQVDANLGADFNTLLATVPGAHDLPMVVNAHSSCAPDCTETTSVNIK